MTIAKDSIESVRSRADIVQEIGSRVELKKTGSSYVGLCPFHGEKSPSFSVSSAKQFFHCFGCGKTGDVIQFLMDHDGMNFNEAVKDLGERLGVKVEENQDEASIKRGIEKRQIASSLEDVCEQISVFYSKSLQSSIIAQEYLVKRGISEEVANLYGIGYAPSGRTDLAAIFKDYKTSKQLLEAGAVIDSESGERFDRFRGRIMFPIRNAKGRCIGFGGRVFGDEKPKYLNSPETSIFLKHQVLYGLNEARSGIVKAAMAYVAEGYMDVVAMAQHGITNAVAALGTAFSVDHAQHLFRFTDRICFVFDGDEAGKKASWKALQTILPLINAKQKVSFLSLPDGADPDDYLKAHGAAKFTELTQQAPTLSQYMLKELLGQYGADGKLSSAEAKTQFLTNAEALCATMSEANPLKSMILQEIDVLVGRAVRTPPAPQGSAYARLAALSRPASNSGGSLQAPQAASQRPWLPREEWLRNLRENGPGTFTGSKVSSQTWTPHKRKSFWVQLTEAVVMSPRTAQGQAPSLFPLLDIDSAEEADLMIALEAAPGMTDNHHKYAADQLLSAIDLLTDAKQAISRQRTRELTIALKVALRQGELSDSEFISEIAKL